jgi:hypothetical protein
MDPGVAPGGVPIVSHSLHWTLPDSFPNQSSKVLPVRACQATIAAAIPLQPRGPTLKGPACLSLQLTSAVASGVAV